ncbi:MAG: type II toxin-antitoxin system PemK/MazF family toxin [Oscillospiraceae bacterium]|jgi:mRNA interferase MazF|nr:type II toxin-antitoxin system PemK/MazF family toxin [Oscillospiraceae bacterium]
MYQPEQGDIVMMNFTPQAGHEQADRRPALVISNRSFHRYTRMAIVCPISNQIMSYPMHVRLNAQTQTTGEVLCEHVKSLDLAARSAAFIERIPEELLSEVLERVHLSIQ